MPRLLLGTVLAFALGVALSGCAHTHIPSSPNDSESTSEEKVDIPSGFTSGGFGLATKWSTPETCEGTGSEGGCVVVEVFAYMDCSDGAYVEANAIDEDLVVVASTRGDLDGLSIGQSERIELFFDAPTAQDARQTAARCI